jgi:phosphoglycolate phosphatase-like HAD superfamily hydrolase
MPIYMMEMTNPRSSRGVIEVLTQILDVEIDMTEIDDWVRKTDEEIEKNLLRLMTSQEEGARRLVEYFDRLKKQADVEEAREEMPQPEADELLKEIERFLKGQGGEKDDRG